MCGIAGVYRFGAAPIKLETINLLLLGNQRRGTDASGVAILNPEGQVAVCKNDDIAWKFVDLPVYKEFMKRHLTLDTRAVLVHTRAATHSGVGDGGNPRRNINNHPLYAGQTAIIHNGMIANHQFLFKELNLEREAETDSDIIRAILDEEGLTRAGVRRLERMSGSAAIAAMSPKHPDEVLLGRCGNPIILAMDEEKDQLLWASEKGTIHAATRDWREIRGIWMQQAKSPLKWRTMPNDTVYLIGPEGLKWHQKFQTSTYYKAPTYENQYGEYGSRQKRFDATANIVDKEAERKELKALPFPKIEGGDISQADEDDIEDAQVMVECEGCKRWSYFTQAKEELSLDSIVCGHCGELVRKTGIVI